MTKTTKIFLIILSIELIATIISYFIPDTCGSACAKPGFLNPLGRMYKEGFCTLQCVEYQPGKLFYTFADLFFVTLLIFGVTSLAVRIAMHKK